MRSGVPSVSMRTLTARHACALVAVAGLSRSLIANGSSMIVYNYCQEAMRQLH